MPDDYISRKYFSIVENYEKLPASMTDGLGNLEVKEPDPIKQIPSFRKLINGDYQTATIKSDKNISSSIKLFFNNLPSFQQFKNDDNLDWVIISRVSLITHTWIIRPCLHGLGVLFFLPSSWDLNFAACF